MSDLLVADFSSARVGDRVKTSRGLRGCVVQNDKNNEHGMKGIEINPHPILVLFDGEMHPTCLTYEGKYHSSDKYPTVFYDYRGQLPTIEACKRPLPEIEVDEKVLVWEDDYGEISKEKKGHFAGFCIDGCMSVWANNCTEWSGNGFKQGGIKYWKTADGKYDSGNLEDIKG